MQVKKLLHTRMRVSDIDQTIHFYTDVLGLEVVERKTSPRGSHLAFLKVPNSEELIELASFPPSGPVKVQEERGVDSLIGGSEIASLGEVLLTLAFIPFIVYFMLTWKEHARRSMVRLFPPEAK